MILGSADDWCTFAKVIYEALCWHDEVTAVSIEDLTSRCASHKLHDILFQQTVGYQISVSAVLFNLSGIHLSVWLVGCFLYGLPRVARVVAMLTSPWQN